MVFEDVGPGAERRIDSGSLELPSPGSFLVIVVSGIEADDFSADDSLGRSAVWIREFELSCLAGTRTRRVLPRLTGDGGEYAVEVELDFG
jgi:hypothetical protein